ncbi:MAG: beta-galactosidase trimerization domain-containing protein [Anaerolineae bacterium]|jgi:beta-galactosidase|nr:beta-galactosidase trimerization domain-containing protein [Anaerolineae bacterium]
MNENTGLNIPLIGAQVFIEPGQTAEEIENLFRTLREHHLTVCRIRMFEKYIRTAKGGWDFSLFDIAFDAAQKYGIKIMATLFPMTEFTDVGGFKFPHTDAHLAQVAAYIHQLVRHYRTFPALWAWVLINEPGVVNLPDEPFTNEKFAAWKTTQPSAERSLHGYYQFPFEKERFLLEYNTWYLQWIADKIKQQDPEHHLHVNNHAIFQNVAEYDFPAWRTFLDSFGGSAHASWHFGYFDRSQYTLAMAADCSLVQSGAGEKPWLMTEIQGGNNTYSGFHAMCPTNEEISQWLWTILGCGGKGGIFWTLNSRASGFEAGEWAMLDMQDQPTDRLLAAADVAQTIHKNEEFFANAEPVTAPIHILYTRESLWIEKTLQRGGSHYEGREVGGVMKSALGYYQTLSDMGVTPHMGEIGEFNFALENYTGTAIILAHQVSIPSKYWDKLRSFVERGGKLIMDGLTAYYDEHAHCIMKHDFPLADLCGAHLKEFKLKGNLFDLKVNRLRLPAHCWQGTLECQSAQPAAQENDKVCACRNSFGKGEVLWMPALVGIAARMAGTEKLALLLKEELKDSIQQLQFGFSQYSPNVLLRTLQGGDDFLCVVINKNDTAVDVALVLPGSMGKRSLHLEPEATRIIRR